MDQKFMILLVYANASNICIEGKKENAGDHSVFYPI